MASLDPSAMACSSAVARSRSCCSACLLRRAVQRLPVARVQRGDHHAQQAQQSGGTRSTPRPAEPAPAPRNGRCAPPGTSRCRAPGARRRSRLAAHVGGRHRLAKGHVAADGTRGQVAGRGQRQRQPAPAAHQRVAFTTHQQRGGRARRQRPASPGRSSSVAEASTRSTTTARPGWPATSGATTSSHTGPTGRSVNSYRPVCAPAAAGQRRAAPRLAQRRRHGPAAAASVATRSAVRPAPMHCGCRRTGAVRDPRAISWSRARCRRARASGGTGRPTARCR
jgi:hypothetical protein